MSNERILNNHVVISGEVVSPFIFSHEIFGEEFYTVSVAVKRLSGKTDIIPVMISERLVDVAEDLTGANVRVAGQFRSYNRHEEKKIRLDLHVFVCEWELMDEWAMETAQNRIFLEGSICKPPIYRKTPLGREIAEFLIAVNRTYGKSDYIPCICWGRNARYAGRLDTGSYIIMDGRIQSREYTKKISETECEVRTAYEVSISRMEGIAH